MAEKVLQIYAFKDGAYVGSCVFASVELTIGSGTNADFVLQDDLLQPHHAVLSQDKKKIRILNLGGPEDTQVNGESVRSQTVSTRDEIQIGAHTLRLKWVRNSEEISRSIPPAFSTPVALRPVQSEARGDTEVSAVPNEGTPDASPEAGQTGESTPQAEYKDLVLDDEPHSSLLSPSSTAVRLVDKLLDESQQPEDRAPTFIDPAPQAEANPVPISRLKTNELETETPLTESPSSDPSRPIRFDTADRPAKLPALRPKLPQVDEEEFEEPDEEEARLPPGFLLFTELANTPPSLHGDTLKIVYAEQGAIHSIHLTDTLNQPIHPSGHPSCPIEVKRLSSNIAVVRFHIHATGRMTTINGPHFNLAALVERGEATRISEKELSLQIKQGQTLTLHVEDASYHIRFVTPPSIYQAQAARRSTPAFAMTTALGSSIFSHLFIALILGFSIPSTSFSDRGQEIWADAQVRLPEAQDPSIQDEVIQSVPEAEDPPQLTANTSIKLIEKPRKSSARNAARPPRTTTRVPPHQGIVGIISQSYQSQLTPNSFVASSASAEGIRAPGKSAYRLGALVSKAPTGNIKQAQMPSRRGQPPSPSRGTAGLLRGESGLLSRSPTRGVPALGVIEPVYHKKIIVRGKIPKRLIANVLNQNLEQLRGCYDLGLRETPNLSGTCTLEWTTDEDGYVNRVREKPPRFRNAQVTACMIRQLQTWRFPPSRTHTAVISYGFKLRLADTDLSDF